MSIAGHIFQITDITGFFNSVGLTILQDSENWTPDPTTFSPLANARVELRHTSFFPIPTLDDIEDLTDAQGAFTLTIPPIPQGFPGRFQMLVHKRDGRRPLAGPFKPIYRSVAFEPGNQNQQVVLYVFPLEVGEDAQITQAFINSEIDTAREQMELTELTATIHPDKIAVDGRRRRNKIRFDLTLFPSTSHNLDVFIAHRIANLNVDLTFFADLCVNADKLEQKIRVAIRDLLKDVNEDIRDTVITAIAEAANQTEGIAEVVYDQKLSLIFADLDVVGPSGNRSIVPEPWMGLPRNPLS